MESFPIKLPLSASSSLLRVEVRSSHWADRLLWVPLYLEMPENDKLVRVQREYDWIDSANPGQLAEAVLYAPHPLKPQWNAFELGQGLRAKLGQVADFPEFERGRLLYEFLNQGAFLSFKKNPELFIPFAEGFLGAFGRNQLALMRDLSQSENVRFDALILRQGIEAFTLVLLGYSEFSMVQEWVANPVLASPEWSHFRKAIAVASERAGATENWGDILSMQIDTASLKLRSKWQGVFGAA